MEKRKLTSEGYFRSLMILFAGMLMSQFTFAGTVIYLNATNELPIPDEEFQSTFIYVLVAVGSLGLGASFFIANMLIAKAANKSTLAEKLRGYMTAAIIRYALLEAPSLLGIIGFWLTGQYVFFVATALAVIIFFLTIPTKVRVFEALRLTSPEMDVLNDPKAVVMEYNVSTGPRG